MRRLLPLLLLALGACPGNLEDPARFRGDWCLASTERMFRETCSTSDCHSAADHAGGLDLETLGVADRLRGVAANDDPLDEDDECSDEVTGCANENCVLLNPNNPEASLLYTKASPGPPCGDRMPQIGNPLSGEQIDCLLEWIVANAASE
jgi:hypothetical protein